MNPNGIFTPKAKQTARNQYLANLRLQQANIDYNLNANRIYNETQQISRPNDTRTAEERLADIESLRQFVRESLDFTGNAGNIVNELDTSELQYVAQNINRVITDIKDRFAIGVTTGKMNSRPITTIIRRLKQEDENSAQIDSGIQVSVEKINNQRQTKEKPTKIEQDEPAAAPKGNNPLTKEMLESPLFKRKKEIVDKDTKETDERKRIVTELIRLGYYKDGRGANGKTIGQLKEILQEKNVEFADAFVGKVEPSGRGLKKKPKNIIMGCGLAKPKVKVTPENIDTTLGIQPVKSYVPLGRYLLNKTKLSDNVLMIKHIKGGAVGQLPTIHISNKLVGVLKHLITSQLPPDFDSLNGLDDKEKKLLHKIAKSTEILERFSIPNPNLTQEQQDINRFEILRGMMNAGSDSKELVKEFKLLLLKLMNAGKIPRREGQEILTDFIALGY